EMVTAPTLWSSVPDPFDLSTDSRTWTHYVESVEFQARKVTWHVDPSIMRKQPRKNAEHTLSDVDRAVKRVGAWSRLVMTLIPYRDVVSIQHIWSPVDPSISKRAWEFHLYDLRQSVVLLETETHQAGPEFCGVSPRHFDFQAGTSTPTHEQWLVLSERRASALLRRHLQLGTQSSDDFFFLWQRSMSPYCCPSYMAGITSMIRLPCFRHTDVKLPAIENTPDDVFLRLEYVSADCTLLADLHGHAKDRFVSFVQESHSYYVEGRKEFRADEVIQKMMASHRWPRPEYSHHVGDTVVPFTADEIKQMWSRNAREAAARGTWMHLQVEVLLNAGSVQDDCIELRLFRQFLQEFPDVCGGRCSYGFVARTLRPAELDGTGMRDSYIHDEVGGAMTPEILELLPPYFFSGDFLSTCRCRVCPNQLMDYLGGASSQESFDARILQDIADEMEVATPEEIVPSAAVDADNADEQPAEADLALAIPCPGLSPEALVSAKKRRLMPGASTSGQDFEALFDLTSEACSSSLSSFPAVDEQQPVAADMA
ncbi:unnamed protein product, partial [Symbiodinium necroappetens]